MRRLPIFGALKLLLEGIVANPEPRHIGRAILHEAEEA